jgi:predicted chitinase
MNWLFNLLRKLLGLAFRCPRVYEFLLGYSLEKLSQKQDKQLKLLEAAISKNADKAIDAKECAHYFWLASKTLGIKLTADMLPHIFSQFGHETGGFRFLVEHSPKGVDAYQYFESKYGMRKDLGNIEKGDGYKYRGRGFAHITGRANYQHFGQKLGIDLINEPDLASDKLIAAKIALLYFVERALRKISYRDFERDVFEVSKAINHPAAKRIEQINGFADRMKRALQTKEALQC